MSRWRGVIAFLVFYVFLAAMIVLWAGAPVEPVDPVEQPVVVETPDYVGSYYG